MSSPDTWIIHFSMMVISNVLSVLFMWIICVNPDNNVQRIITQLTIISCLYTFVQILLNLVILNF